jgi:hypothetical protein
MLIRNTVAADAVSRRGFIPSHLTLMLLGHPCSEHMTSRKIVNLRCLMRGKERVPRSESCIRMWLVVPEGSEFACRNKQAERKVWIIIIIIIVIIVMVIIVTWLQSSWAPLPALSRLQRKLIVLLKLRSDTPNLPIHPVLTTELVSKTKKQSDIQGLVASNKMHFGNLTMIIPHKPVFYYTIFWGVTPKS